MSTGQPAVVTSLAVATGKLITSGRLMYIHTLLHASVNTRIIIVPILYNAQVATLGWIPLDPGVV